MDELQELTTVFHEQQQQAATWDDIVFVTGGLRLKPSMLKFKF